MYSLRRASISLLISIAIHIIAVMVIGFKMNAEEQETDEYVTVDWVKVPPPKLKRTREPLFVKRMKKFRLARSIERKTDSQVGITVIKQKSQTVKKGTEPIKTNVQLSSVRKSSLISSVTTEANVELKCIAGEEKPTTSGRIGRAGIKLAEAAYRSSASGMPVKIAD